MLSSETLDLLLYFIEIAHIMWIRSILVIPVTWQ